MASGEIWPNVSRLIGVVSVTCCAETVSNDETLIENLGRSDLANSARSGVEMINLDLEISRQCSNVLSKPSGQRSFSPGGKERRTYLSS